MSGQTQQGDRTEKPTTKRKRDASERGQVVRSRDLAGALSLVAVTLTLGWMGSSVMGMASDRMVSAFNDLGSRAHETINPTALAGIVWSDLRLIALIAGPPAMVAAVVSIAQSYADSIMPKLPLANSIAWSRPSLIMLVLQTPVSPPVPTPLKQGWKPVICRVVAPVAGLVTKRSAPVSNE